MQIPFKFPFQKRILKTALLFAMAFCAGNLSARAVAHFTNEQPSVPAAIPCGQPAAPASADGNWGLSFQSEGQTPVGNATSDYLKQFHAYYAGPAQEKVIYLTFDAGYENGNTPAILDALKKHRATATFFLVGNYLETSPELVKRMASDAGCPLEELVRNHEALAAIDLNKYVEGDLGLPTLTDIVAELEKPGRDPREKAAEFAFDENVSDISDLAEGMVLPGIVNNITDFGAFVDIGVHESGLIHISQIAARRVSHPSDVLKLHQQVKVRVISVDLQRKRIGLSLRDVGQ